MAHKKGMGSTKNGRDSESKRLGVKRADGQYVLAGQTFWFGREERRFIREPMLAKAATIPYSLWKAVWYGSSVWAGHKKQVSIYPQ